MTKQRSLRAHINGFEIKEDKKRKEQRKIKNNAE
jgi:hypothetical protein